MPDKDLIQSEEDSGHDTSVHKVAFFMDFDNMIGTAGSPVTNKTLLYLMDKLLQLGSLEHAGIYTDVRHIGNAQNSSYDLLTQADTLGFQIRHCPKLNGSEIPKDTVDEHLADDAYNLLEKRPDIDTFIFATHDRNFLPVMNSVKRHRKTVVIVINSPTGSRRLEQVAHRIININIPAEKPQIAQVSADLKTFLSQEYESPDQLIASIREQGLANHRDLKIALDMIICIDAIPPEKYPAFKYLLDWLRAQATFKLSGHFFDENKIKGILHVLMACGIVVKHEEENRTHYSLNREHFFVQVALNEGHLEKVKDLFDNKD